MVGRAHRVSFHPCASESRMSRYRDTHYEDDRSQAQRRRYDDEKGDSSSRSRNGRRDDDHFTSRARDKDEEDYRYDDSKKHKKRTLSREG